MLGLAACRDRRITGAFWWRLAKKQCSRYSLKPCLKDIRWASDRGHLPSSSGLQHMPTGACNCTHTYTPHTPKISSMCIRYVNTGELPRLCACKWFKRRDTSDPVHFTGGESTCVSYSASWVIREMLIKTIMRWHFTLPRLSKIKSPIAAVVDTEQLTLRMLMQYKLPFPPRKII